MKILLASNPEASTPAMYTPGTLDRKSTRLNSSHGYISYAVFCLKKNKKNSHRSYYDPHKHFTALKKAIDMTHISPELLRSSVDDIDDKLLCLRSGAIPIANRACR